MALIISHILLNNLPSSRRFIGRKIGIFVYSTWDGLTTSLKEVWSVIESDISTAFAVIRRLTRLGNMVLLLPHLDISIHLHGDIETTIDTDAIYITITPKKLILCIFILNPRLIVFSLIFSENSTHIKFDSLLLLR